jgi:uncharacterized protein YndB with AHSA1/START domain
VSEPLIMRARAAVPIRAVHHALTDAGALRTWLAERAEVDLPHRFAFWGRFTPEGDAPHQRLLHVDDHTLRFNWLLDGEDTTTEIRLQAEGPNSTLLTLSQTHYDFQDVITGASIRGVLQTFWALSIANLVDCVAGRELTPKCDFTSPHLQAQVLIAASREAVYDSLIDSEKVSKWFGYPIELEPRVGGRVAMGGFDAGGPTATITDFEPGHKLSVHWGDSGVTT